MNTPNHRTGIRVLVAEVSEVARQAIAAELGALDGVEIVAWSASGATVVEQVRVLRPDLVVLGLDLGGVDGVEVYGALRIACPEVTVLIFDTLFRAGNVMSGETAQETDEALAFVASYVVATQLVPKVRSVFRRNVGVPAQD